MVVVVIRVGHAPIFVLVLVVVVLLLFCVKIGGGATVEYLHQGYFSFLSPGGIHTSVAAKMECQRKWERGGIKVK